MRAFITEFDVFGSTTFPLDMLRSDECYPANYGDVLLIEEPATPAARAQARILAPVRRVRLVHVGVAEEWSPNYERWQSFGWTVVDFHTR